MSRPEEAQHTQSNTMQEALDELMNLMTIMYMMIQEVLANGDELGDLETQLRECSVSELSQQTN